MTEYEIGVLQILLGFLLIACYKYREKYPLCSAIVTFFRVILFPIHKDQNILVVAGMAILSGIVTLVGWEPTGTGNRWLNVGGMLIIIMVIIILLVTKGTVKHTKQKD